MVVPALAMIAVGAVLVVGAPALSRLPAAAQAAGWLLGLLAVAGLLVAALLRRRRARAARASALRRTERAVLEVYDDWLVQEAVRGQRDLERWCRTHTPGSG